MANQEHEHHQGHKHHEEHEHHEHHEHAECTQLIDGLTKIASELKGIKETLLQISSKK